MRESRMCSAVRAEDTVGAVPLPEVLSRSRPHDEQAAQPTAPPGGLRSETGLNGSGRAPTSLRPRSSRTCPDQHLKLESDDADEPIVTPAEAKIVISGTVNNLQVNQNALGVQITD